MSNSSLALASLASQCATALLDAKQHDDKAKAFREAANVAVAQLHKAKAVVGRKGACSIATAFYDTLVSGGLAKGTANNYLSVFRDAVKTGKPVTDWNPNRKGAKGKNKSGKAKGSKAFADLFRPAFNHESGKTFEVLCQEIQVRYENAEFDNLYDGFVNFFKAEGDEIAE